MSDEFAIEWGCLQLIPAGLYEAVYVSHETFNQSFGAKVKITFRIITPGDYFGVMIDAWYNVKALKNKPGKQRSVVLSRHSKLTTELLTILSIKERVARLSPAQLKGKILEVAVRTVKKNSRQKSYTESQIYSVVDRIVRLHSDDRCATNKLKPKLIPEPTPTSKPLEPVNTKLVEILPASSFSNLVMENGM